MREKREKRSIFMKQSKEKKGKCVKKDVIQNKTLGLDDMYEIN